MSTTGIATKKSHDNDTDREREHQRDPGREQHAGDER